jgi:lipid-A-disaccharide synthase
VAVDSPDFHLPVARLARRWGIRTVGYVSPQLWAWRRGRAAAVAAALDQLLCLFSFEPALYAGTGLDARWVGHPAVDRVGPSAREPGVLALFPGSRPAEVYRHLPVFLDVGRRIGCREILVAGADGIRRVPLDGARWVDRAEALGRAERALTKSGTVTLELAQSRIPFVVAHRVHPVTYWIGRALVRGVRFLALPNVLAGREVVAEYVQRFTVEELEGALKVAGEAPVVDLGPQGVAERAAAVVMGGG